MNTWARAGNDLCPNISRYLAGGFSDRPSDQGGARKRSQSYYTYVEDRFRSTDAERAAEVVNHGVETAVDREGRQGENACMASKKSRKKEQDLKDMSFEQLMAEFEDVVGRVEKGQLPLEQTVELFEYGMSLAREASRRLDDAERRIKVLIEKNGVVKEVDVDEAENDRQ